MAHLIETFVDGSASVFSHRQPMWHKLGTVTENALTVDEALKTAQMDWLVEKSPIQTVYNGQVIEVKDKFATVRKHEKKATADVLGIVGDRYEVVQNHEAFEILNDIVDQSGAVFETAGALAGGKRVFVTMELPQHVRFSNGDTAGLYLMATNSHDGRTACQIAVTPIRVVCQNTLTMAVRAARSSFSIRHTKNASRRIEEARAALGLTFTYVDAFQMEVERLIAEEFTKQEFERLIAAAFPAVNEDNTLAVKNADERTTALLDLWDAPTQANSKGTKWAAFNSVVEYLDWVRPEANEKHRAEKVLAGHSTHRIKARTLSLL
jgi:phage/plasmid-like protein (TIGR03299 family)